VVDEGQLVLAGRADAGTNLPARAAQQAAGQAPVQQLADESQHSIHHLPAILPDCAAAFTARQDL
jgi:hypothetical protein